MEGKPVQSLNCDLKMARDGLGWCIADWLTHDGENTRHITFGFSRSIGLYSFVEAAKKKATPSNPGGEHR